MNSRDIAHLDPRLQPLAKEFLARCQAAGVNAFLTCTYRSNAEQAKLYAIGRNGDKRKKVTNAGPGQSRHNATDAAGKPASTAFDIAIKHADGSLNWDARSKAWATAGAIGMSLGLDWGGSWAKFKDAPHFQLKL